MSKVFLSPATLAGASLAGALVFAAYLGLLANDAAPPSAPAAPQAAVPAASPAQGAPAVAQPVALADSCPSQPLLQARDAADGRFALQAALDSGAQVQPTAFVVVSREAAQDGRVRDAEVALLAACHLAERAAGAQSAAVADLKSELGQHYLLQAQAEGADSAWQELVLRASTLFSESAGAYAAALGRDASKTRMAQQRVAMLSDPAAARQNLRLFAAAQPSTATLGAARAQSDAGAAQGAQDADCNASAARRLICADPELAQLDRDMRRLHAQAASVSRDPGGMRRRDGAAAAREASCQDKACLLRWFAQRRSQLLAEF